MLRVSRAAVFFLCATTFFLILGCGKKEADEQAGDHVDESTNVSHSKQEKTFEKPELVPTMESRGKEGKDPNLTIDLSHAVVHLDEVVELWDRGERKSATEKFLRIKSKSSVIFSEVSILNLSEEEFISLPALKRSEMQAKISKFTKKIRELVKHVLELGKASVTTKDYNAAERKFYAVRECGLALSRHKSLAIVKAVGRGIERAALRELTKLYTKTGNQVKLKAVQESLSRL